MKWDYVKFSDFDFSKQQIFMLTLLLPPPLTLDNLVALSDISPLKTLNISEELVRSRYLSKYSEMGSGVYYLSDFNSARSFIKHIPQDIILKAAQNAVDKIMENQDDTPQKWLAIAHIHDVSGLPLVHYREMVLAGNYCKDQNLPVDAGTYYLLALESMEKAPLNANEQMLFIDAVTSICTSRNDALSLGVQIRYLGRALEFIKIANDPEKGVRLNVILARSLIKHGKSQEAEAHFDTAWEIMEKHDFPKDFRLKIAMAYVNLCFYQGLISKAIAKYEAVIDPHEDLPSDRELLKGYAVQGWIYGISGETVRGLELVEAVSAKAREINSPELGVYTTMVQVLILLEARLISETEIYVNRLFEFDPIYFDQYFQRVGYAVKAFIAYCQGDYDAAFIYQDEVYKRALMIETDYHRGSVNFEYMVGLEDRGMKHPCWNFDTELQRLSSGSDIHMMGAALRCRAHRAYKRKEPVKKVKEDLIESIRLLEKSGAKIELSRSRVLLARVLLETKNEVEARKLLQSSWEVFSKVNPELMPQDLKPYLQSDSKRAMWIASLLAVGEALISMNERKQLLSEIVCQTMRIVGARCGGIFLKKGEKIDTVVSRNMAPREMSSHAFEFRMKIIEAVLASGKESIKTKFSFQETEKAFRGG